jgi:hypothetical protein
MITSASRSQRAERSNLMKKPPNTTFPARLVKIRLSRAGFVLVEMAADSSSLRPEFAPSQPEFAPNE